ncbi:unnamed protein product [Urochloa humidicola]
MGAVVVVTVREIHSALSLLCACSVHEVSGCVERAEAVRCGGHEQSTGSRASPTIRLLRLEYIMLTEVLDIIGRKNWCRAVVDNQREVAQLYEKDYMLKVLSAPINGCGFFLVASSLPHTRPPESRIISSSNLFKALFQLDTTGYTIEVQLVKSILNTCYNICPAP